MTAFPLAVCAEMIWRDRPIDWRASRLKEKGFGVGLWNWPDHDLSKLEKTGASFTIMNGYLRGRLTDATTSASSSSMVVGFGDASTPSAAAISPSTSSRATPSSRSSARVEPRHAL